MTPSPRNATFAMNSCSCFPQCTWLVYFEVEVLGSNPRKCAIGHARVQGLFKHHFQARVVLTQADTDSIADIGRVARHVGGDDATLAFPARCQEAFYSVLIANDK